MSTELLERPSMQKKEVLQVTHLICSCQRRETPKKTVCGEPQPEGLDTGLDCVVCRELLNYPCPHCGCEYPHPQREYR